MSADFENIYGKIPLHLSMEGIRKFPLAPMGVLEPGSAHARPSAQPSIDTSGNCSAHVSGRVTNFEWAFSEFNKLYPGKLILTWEWSDSKLVFLSIEQIINRDKAKLIQ